MNYEIQFLKAAGADVPGPEVYCMTRWNAWETNHRSSSAFLVEMAAGIVAISNCFFKYPNFEQNIPLGVQESMEECMRSYALIHRSANLIAPLYDPDVLRRHPGGRIP
jgi:hypothetical protein